MSTPTIQLAFQGGGAKLAAMLPIAEAFRQAERDGFIEISRVSGTSAGAICAALIATQADFHAVRKYVVASGPQHLAALIPDRLKALLGKVKGGRQLGWWDLFAERHMLKQVTLGGTPLLKSLELRNFISGIMSAGDPLQRKTIEECPAKLIITASDIVAAAGIIHERGEIISAVEDSCSLPVLLRSFGNLSTNHRVDGGLCDNLPVDCLMTDIHSPIFAVYPAVAEAPRDNSNLLSYFVSLLSASINHNVKRSISMVGKPYRFPAETDIGLLDFDRAVEHLARDDWYKIALDDALERIVSFSKSYGFTLARSQARVVDTVDTGQYRKTLSNLTESAGRAPQLHCVKGKFVVRINHDRRMQASSAKARRAPDTITRISQMRVLCDDLRFYRATVNVTEDSIVPTIWSARNLTRNADVPLVALPLLRDSVAGVHTTRCLLEFVDSENHFSVGDIIELQSTYPALEGGDMRKLNMGQPDYFGFTNSTGMTIDEVELILVYPKSLGDISLHVDQKRTKRLTASPTALDLLSMGGLPIDITQAAVGMTVKDLDLGAAFFVTAVPVTS